MEDLYDDIWSMACDKVRRDFSWCINYDIWDRIREAIDLPVRRVIWDGIAAGIDCAIEESFQGGD